MSWVTVIFSMTASACLTTALIYAFIWWRQRDAWAYLLFAVAALATAAFAFCDLAEMRAETPAEFGAAVRWAQVSLWAVILSLAGFVRLYLRAGRLWLLWSVCALRTIAMVLNFLTGPDLNYRQISSLQHIQFLGESISIAKGAPNPWQIVGQLSIYALAVFVADAAIVVWRRGERRRAAFVGGSIVFFLMSGTLQATLIFWGHVQWPILASLLFLGIVAAVNYELGGEVLRVGKLTGDLRASDAQMSMAAEAANLGFWSQDFVRGEFWASDQWRALLGFAKSDRLNTDSILERLHPDDRERRRVALNHSYDGDGRYQAEYRVLLPDGRLRWFASQGRVEFNGAHQPVRIQGVSMDITHRKQADLEAQAHRNEVAHLLRVASLGELSSSLAHELTQPLSAILSNAQAAELFLARDIIDLQEIREILHDIVTEDRRAGDVIARLRTLLRKGEFQPQGLDANTLIQDVLKLLHHDLMLRGVQVVTECYEDLPLIGGDRVQLQQVLINLILNAADAMTQPAQNARTLTLRSGRIEGGTVRISVTDTGTGIAAGAEEKIFEPYHTSKPHGLGLGLSLSRSIVSSHGGRLWAENVPTGGATFHLTIPEWPCDAVPPAAG
jgi:two-component system, LuxR family, sensor kinase FixL